MRISAPPRRLVSVAAAAQYLDVDPRTVRRHIASGRIPAYRVGPKLVKIDLDALGASLQPIPTAGGDRVT